MIRYPAQPPERGEMPPTPDYAWPSLDTPQIVSGFRSSPPRERQEAMQCILSNLTSQQKRPALAGGGGGSGSGAGRLVKSAGMEKRKQPLSAAQRDEAVRHAFARSPRPKQHTFTQNFAPRRLPPTPPPGLSSIQAPIVGRPTALLAPLPQQQGQATHMATHVPLLPDGAPSGLPSRPGTAPAAPEADAVAAAAAAGAGGRVVVRNAFALPSQYAGIPTIAGGAREVLAQGQEGAGTGAGTTPVEGVAPPPPTPGITSGSISPGISPGFTPGAHAAPRRPPWHPRFWAASGPPAHMAEEAAGGASRPASASRDGADRTAPMPQAVSGVTVTSRPGSAARRKVWAPEGAPVPESPADNTEGGGVPPTPNATPMKA